MSSSVGDCNLPPDKLQICQIRLLVGEHVARKLANIFENFSEDIFVCQPTVAHCPANIVRWLRKDPQIYFFRGTKIFYGSWGKLTKRLSLMGGTKHHFGTFSGAC